MHLLTSLAADPATSAALLDALARFAQAGADATRRSVRAALVGNAAVAFDVRRTLLATCAPGDRTQVFAAAAAGTAVGDLLPLLPQPTPPGALAAILQASGDPDGRLARFAHTQGLSLAISYAMVTSATCPLDVKLAAATHVGSVKGAKPSAHVCAAIADTLRTVLDDGEHHEQAHSAAVTLAASAHAPLRSAMSALLAPSPNQERTAALRALPVGQAIGYARECASARTWVQVLRTHPDPTGELAQAAVNACDSVSVLRELATRPGVPGPVARKAVSRLTLTKHLTARTRTARDALLRHGDRSWAVRYVRRWPEDSRAVRAVTARADLTSADLDVLHEAFVVHSGLLHERQWYMHEREGRARWFLQLATYPSATAEQRALGRDLLARETAKFGAGQVVALAAGRLARGCADLTDAPGSAAHTGLQLAVTDLNNENFTLERGMRWLTTEALTHVSAQVNTPGAAHAFVSLVGTFTGTLAELVDVAVAVGATTVR